MNNDAVSGVKHTLLFKTAQTILIASFAAFGICETANAAIQFNEESVSIGVDLLDNTNGGLAWIDYDNDGDLDLFIPTTTKRLYRNLLNETNEVGFEEVSIVNLPVINTAGRASVGDYDGDGCDDIYIAGQNILIRNNTCDAGYQPGDDVFSDVTGDSQIVLDNGSTASAFGDVDNDGDLDLYVVNFGSLAPSELFINNGGTFTEFPIPDHIGSSWAVTLTDYDNDGDLDVFHTNDTFFCDNLGACGAPPSEIHKNLLKETGSLGFEPIGLDIHIAAMGVAIGDYNNDGNLDYYQSDIGNGVLTTGNGKSVLAPEDSKKLVNPIDPTDSHSGWGTAFIDADNDGFQDIFRTNKFTNGVGTGGPNHFLLNNGDVDENGDVTFTEMAAIVGLEGASPADRGFGLAVADYDNDGRVDTITGSDQGVRIYRNGSTLQNWVKFNLVGNNPNHRGVGAKVLITSSLGKDLATQINQMREIHAGSSYGSTNDHRANFGLGDHDSLAPVLVEWPDGCTQIVTGVSINQETDVVQAQCVPTYTISGTVTTSSGIPVENLPIHIADNFDFGTVVTTDANGFYSQVVKDGTYVVYGELGPDYSVSCGYIFTGVSGSDVTKDCSAKPIISGTVTTPTGQPVAGIDIQIADNFDFSTTVTTDADGNYSQAVNDGLYIVYGKQSPVYQVFCGFIFASVSGQPVSKDCTATPVISGTVTTSAGEPVAGIQIKIADNFGFSATVTTNSQGNYRQPVADGTYIVYAPQNPGYVVSCGYIFVGISGVGVVKDCSATPQ